MKQGHSMQSDMILKYIGNEQINNILSFSMDVKSRNFVEFKDEEEIRKMFSNYLNDYFSKISYSEVESIKYYSGYFFKEINAIARNNWNYEDNGLLTDKRKNELTNIIKSLNNVISKFDKLPCDMIVFRGVSLNAFFKYGITSIDDLVSLKGNFVYDSGFCSTSMVKDKSFFNRKLENGSNSDILIEYLIPNECNDGVPLISSELSYSPGQCEFLINNGNLSYIDSVEIKDKKAYLKAILIPKKEWDIEYANSLENNSKKL